MNHPIARALERYNQEFTKHDIDCIKALIMQGKSISVPELETNSKSRHFHYVKHKKIPIKVLYANSRNGYEASVLTVYPLDVDEYNRKAEEKKIYDIKKAIICLKENGYVVYKNWRKKQ